MSQNMSRREMIKTIGLGASAATQSRREDGPRG